MKKYGKRAVFFLPFVCGTAGFLIASEPFPNACFYSLCMYFLNYTGLSPNLLTEIARWTAPMMTASGILLAMRAMRERVREWIVYKRGGSIAVYGPDEAALPLLEELGPRGIRIRDWFPRAERYIFLGGETENFRLYQENREKLKGHRVYLKCASMNSKKTQTDLKLFSEEEIAARLYWKQECLFTEAKAKDYRLKLVFTDFGPLEQQLLLWGLQNNIFHPGQKLEYHIFGEAGRFRAVYHELDRMGDPVVFHREPWYSGRKLLEEADCIFVSDTAGKLSDLLFMLPEKTLDVFAEDEEATACCEEQSRLRVFCWRKEALKAANILEDALLVRAKSINLRYAHLYGGVEETQQNRETEWNKLNAFTKYSNISAADYHEVRLKMIGAWRQETGNTDPDAALMQDLAELEHIRWCRYHYLNNWTYGVPENGKSKDAIKRIHADLIPFEELTPQEKEKDMENIRVLLSVAV